MIILFDAYMKYPDYRELVKSDIDLYDFFFGLTEFAISRLEPLREEIEYEEDQEKMEVEKSKGTIIYVLLSNTTEISFVGYSDGLKNKMASCFRKEDFDFIFKKITEFRRARNN